VSVEELRARDEFVRAAPVARNVAPESQSSPGEGSSEQSWEQLDPRAKPSKSFLLRLNEWEHTLLDELAKREERSMHFILRRLVHEALEAEGRRLEDNHSTSIGR
jgi:hypothetical protein